MLNRTKEGQIAMRKDPRGMSGELFEVEIVEAVLAGLLSGENPRTIARRQNLKLADLEQIRELYSQVTLQEIRTWHSLGFIEESWKLIFEGLKRIRTAMPKATASEAANIVSKLFEKQDIARMELEGLMEPPVEGSDTELKEGVQRMTEQLHREGFIEDADFKELNNETTGKETS